MKISLTRQESFAEQHSCPLECAALYEFGIARDQKVPRQVGMIQQKRRHSEQAHIADVAKIGHLAQIFGRPASVSKEVSAKDSRL
jgi:hypothetical protein